MTSEQLKKANEIQEEIDKFNKIFSMLDSTIKYEEDKAHVILFRGNTYHGEDIPVDIDFLKYLRSYFQDRMDEKKKELGDI